MLASACASTPEHDGSGDELEGSDSDSDSASRDSGKSSGKDAGKDSGKSTSGGSTSTGSGGSSGSKADAGKASGGDGGITLPGLGELGGLLGGASDGGAAKPSGDGGMCENLVCFDIFDCAIFHPDALDCGFTKCEGFVCKK